MAVVLTMKPLELQSGCGVDDDSPREMTGGKRRQEKQDRRVMGRLDMLAGWDRLLRGLVGQLERWTRRCRTPVEPTVGVHVTAPEVIVTTTQIILCGVHVRLDLPDHLGSSNNT